MAQTISHPRARASLRPPLVRSEALLWNHLATEMISYSVGIQLLVKPLPLAETGTHLKLRLQPDTGVDQPGAQV